MTTAELYDAWVLWLIVGGVITIAAAALLITIALLARRIVRLGGQALAAVTTIEQQTRAIWQLNATNQVATQLAAGARMIRDDGAAIAQALQQSQPRASSPPMA